MPELTEGMHAGEFIASEANGSRSREVVTIDTGDLVAGQVLGVITASGKYVAFNQDAVDGSEVAAAILYDNTDASTADQEAVAIVRDAEVNGNDLTWPSDIEDAEKTAAIAQLAELGVIVR